MLDRMTGGTFDQRECLTLWTRQDIMRGEVRGQVLPNTSNTLRGDRHLLAAVNILLVILLKFHENK